MLCADHGHFHGKICGDGILVMPDRVAPDMTVGLTGLPRDFVGIGHGRVIVDLRAVYRTDSEELRQIVGSYIAEQKTCISCSIARPRKKSRNSS